MKCYHCGAALSKNDFCTSCGADVKTYKTIIRLSNKFYNEGLEKASVRDLSGAVVCLKQSLKYNKKNIQARNLLGLVYYEMGEIVAALSEWVISKNMKSKKNIVDDYIKAVQSNPAKLEEINQSIKKYNLALIYCKQESYDLAVIQLKKVLLVNPKLIKARQLLALMYLKDEEYNLAAKELKKAEEIDSNNTMTLRYLRELEVLRGKKINAISDRKDTRVTYKVGNDTVIQPKEYKENTGISTVINISIGLVLGAVLVWLVVMPAKIALTKSDASKEINRYSEQVAVKAAEVEDLQADIESLKNQNKEIQVKLDEYEGDGGVLNSYDALLTAANLYMDGKATEVADIISGIAPETVESAKDGFKTVYGKINGEVMGEAADEYYKTGYSAYSNGNYEEAIENLQKAYTIDNTSVNALYYMARSYQKSGDNENAARYFQEVIDKFPGTKSAMDAQANLDSITEEE
ncbi:MAG: tetratricopeptide repeat protein [Lachnospiraceae bacterium]|nr:tetratricopeptide repeat protein [Lachnospiraceae bacterium]